MDYWELCPRRFSDGVQWLGLVGEGFEASEDVSGASCHEGAWNEEHRRSRRVASAGSNNFPALTDFRLRRKE
jgi:hypothetical protein